MRRAKEPSTFPSCVHPLGWGGSFHRAERVGRERFAVSLDRGDCCGTADGHTAQSYEHTRPLARIPAQLPLTTMVAALRMLVMWIRSANRLLSTGNVRRFR